MNLGVNEDKGIDMQNVDYLSFSIHTEFILVMSIHKENSKNVRNYKSYRNADGGINSNNIQH